jgi:CelD/BcsL family acetyltransferase involved in cellulose biosynthesis
MPGAALQVALHARPLTDLLGTWAALHAVNPSATPFMSAVWARSWWPHFAAGAEPFVMVVSDGDEIVGLAPLVRRRRGGFRILEPVGMEPGDYWDLLAAPGRREAVADAFARGLLEHAGQWDAWILRCTPADSPVEAALDRAGLSAVLRPRIQAPVLALPDTFDAYLAGLSSSHRQNLRRHLRRLDSGEVALREVTDVAELPAAIDRWQVLRAKQWSAARRPINPTHMTPHFAEFMRDVTEALVPHGLAQVWEFEREGSVVGAYVNFADEHAYHWYLGGFDPEHARLGLGKIAIGHGIRTSIEAGRSVYDFGRGAEAYKYWYGARDKLLAARVVGHAAMRSRAALRGAQALLRRRAPA